MSSKCAFFKVLATVLMAIGLVGVAGAAVVSKTVSMTCGEVYEDIVDFAMSPTPAVEISEPTVLEADATYDVSQGKCVVTIRPKMDGKSKVVVRGTYGSEADSMVIYDVRVQTIEIEKTVKTARDSGYENNLSNATVRIVTHVLFGQTNSVIPNILFFGTHCDRHSLTADAIKQSLEAIAEVGNLDWYLFGNYNANDVDGVKQGGLWSRGEWRKGDTASTGKRINSKGKTVAIGDGFKVLESSHYCLKSFYDYFEGIIDDPVLKDKYDYIIIEIDSGRLALEYNTTEKSSRAGGKIRDPNQELKVAKWLQPYYAASNVIWVVDNGYDFTARTNNKGENYNGYIAKYAADNDPTKKQTAQLQMASNVFAYGSSTRSGLDFGKYRPSNVCGKNHSDKTPFVEMLNNDQWRGLLGIMDPALYIANQPGFAVDYVEKHDNVAVYETYGAEDPTSHVTTKAGHAYDNQMWYDNADQLSAYLKAQIKPIRFEERLLDNIYGVNNSLSILPGDDSVRIYQWPTNRALSGWKKPSELTNGTYRSMADLAKATSGNPIGWVDAKGIHEIGHVGNSVAGTIPNITLERWDLVEVDIVDNGNFLETCLANNRYEFKDGWYHLDPNDGMATDQLYQVSTKVAETNDSTSIKWMQRRIFNVNSDNVTKVYDGIPTNVVINVNWPSDVDPQYVIIKYRNVGEGDESWKSYDPTKGYVNVSDSTNVEFEITYDPDHGGFEPYYGTKYVHITPAPIVEPPPTPGPGPEPDPGPGSGPKPTVEPKGPWAAAYNVEKTYDGLGTNVLYTSDNVIGGVTYRFAYTDEAPAAGSGDWQPYADVFTNATYEAGTTNVVWRKVWMRVEANAAGNYVATNLFAYVRIWPKDLGGGDGGDPAENSIVAEDKSIAYGDVLPELTWKGGHGLVEGDGVSVVELALTNGFVTGQNPGLPKAAYERIISTNAAVALSLVITNSVGADVTRNYTGFFTPGKLTVGQGGMTIGPEGPTDHPPEGEDPIQEMRKDLLPTNGARSVVKTYDGIPTNIVVEVWTPADATLRYSTNGVDFVDADQFVGYVDVTTLAPVWYEATDPAGNYRTVTNRAFVTINPAPIIEPPHDPDDDPPGPDYDPGYPWAGVWNVTKTYDGLGTNIVYRGGHTTSPVTYKFAYTKDAPADGSGDWQDYADVFTNVMYDADGEVRSTNVWMRMTAGANYLATNLLAYVRINPLEIDDDLGKGTMGLHANDTNMLVGAAQPIPSWYGPDGLLPGDGIESVSLVYTNGTWTIGKYEDAITTNSDAKLAFVITNATGEVTKNYDLAFYPGMLTIYEEVKEERGDDIVEDPKTDEDLQDIVEEEKEKYAEDHGGEPPVYVKVQISTTAISNLNDTTTWTSPSVAAVQTNAIIQKAEQQFGRKIADAKFVDIILERTFDPSVADTHTYNDWPAGWDNIGDDNDKFIRVTLKNKVPSGMRLVGVARYHGTEAEIISVKTASTPDDSEWYEDNGDETVTVCAKKFSIYGLLYEENASRLAGKMRWKYHRAQSVFYAGLDVVCTNGNLAALRNLCYIYEDRSDCYLRNLTNANHLSKTSSVIYDGKLFGKQPLPELEAALKASALGVTNHCGVAKSTFDGSEYRSRYVVPTQEERKIALAATSVEKLANYEPTVVNKTLGYLTWQSEGDDTVYWCAMGEGLEPLNTLASNTSRAPLALSQANAALAYGLVPVTPDSDPTLTIDQFVVEADGVYGRVRLCSGSERGIPGSNARLTVLGASSVDGKYAEVAKPTLAADGSFAFTSPAGVTFFRVKLTVVDEIK